MVSYHRVVSCRPFSDGFLPSEFLRLQFLLVVFGQLGRRVLALVLRCQHTATCHVIAHPASLNHTAYMPTQTNINYTITHVIAHPASLNHTAYTPTQINLNYTITHVIAHPASLNHTAHTPTQINVNYTITHVIAHPASLNHTAYMPVTQSHGLHADTDQP